MFEKLAIIGGGNLGKAIAKGFVKANKFEAKNVFITARNTKKLSAFAEQGFNITSNNIEAIQNADLIILAVLPQQFDTVINEIKSYITEKQVVISLITGVGLKILQEHLENTSVVRVMPNTAISIGESMTCISTNQKSKKYAEEIINLFNTVGTTIEIPEEQMTSATALCACGIAFFLRAIRAASQGGTEIGFHSEDALKMAAQTAKGAAALLVELERHPEREIDRVTSPEGCTIAGLNEMEHQGFSSALIKGIVTSANKAGKLY